jgi:hypothetical protein
MTCAVPSTVPARGVVVNIGLVQVASADPLSIRAVSPNDRESELSGEVIGLPR